MAVEGQARSAVRLDARPCRSARRRPSQRVFEERLYPGFTLLANAFGRDDAERSELKHVIWMVVYSLGLRFLEQRALQFRLVEDNPAARATTAPV